LLRLCEHRFDDESFLNSLHCETLLKANALDDDLARRLDARDT